MLSFVVVWFVIRKKYSAWYSSSQCSSSSSSPYHPLIPPLSFRSCPVPLTYARHTSRFLSMFCLTAPIALVGELGNTHVHTCNYTYMFLIFESTWEDNWLPHLFTDECACTRTLDLFLCMRAYAHVHGHVDALYRHWQSKKHQDV